MSYILEALKKAEQQRGIGQVPRIDSEHEPAAARLSSRWIAMVVLVLLINVGLLVVLFWPDDSTDLSEPVAMLPDESDFGVVPNSVAGMNVPHRSENAPANRNVPASLPTLAGVSPQPAIQTVPAPRATPAPMPQSVEAPSMSPPVVAPTPLPESTYNTRALPVWPQVPTHIFQRLRGSLRLDVHVYSDQPQQRFVLINLQKYHEGEQLQEGPVLDAITVEGIVLSLQGEQFLVRAQ